MHILFFRACEPFDEGRETCFVFQGEGPVKGIDVVLLGDFSVRSEVGGC